MTTLRPVRAAQPQLFAPPEGERRLGPFARVALNRPVRREFTYSVPPELEARVRPGMRVAVSLGGLREVGVVVGLEHESAVDPRKLRPIMRALDEDPLLGPELVELARWIAEQYACSWGEALAAALPAALKSERGRAHVAEIRAAPGAESALADLEAKHEKQHRLLRTLIDLGGPIALRELLRQLNLSDAPARTLARRGLVEIRRVRSANDPLETAVQDRPRPERLSQEQTAAVAAITGAIERREGRGFLLQGVTGSGKTEVYLAAIERALALGRAAIVLVPEIALTPQTVGWFRARLEQVAVLHSRMTDAQRLDTWLALARGEVRVVVGARSAIFAPVRDLGVIVVDEEHEPSFKQANAPRYSARDVALERARLSGAACVLGSATPALESWSAAREGRLEHLRLSARAAGAALPAVEVLDLCREPMASFASAARSALGPSRLFSARLRDLVQATRERGEQAILFLNRRGFAPVLWCSGCKATVRCIRCDVALVFHRRIRRLVCHACCQESSPTQVCPTCTKPKLRYLGAGSERVEHELAELVPGVRVQRMDSDTMRRREDYERVLSAFGSGAIDVLVGTQMIAKGLDFPRVTLVGIVDADSALHLPDFRAAERTFQLLAQVAGRAGRGELAGRILVQTWSSDHPAIQFAARHDFEGFARAEVALRAELGYPPHGRLVRALFEDASEEKCARAARALAEALRARIEDPDVLVLGPAPAPIAQMRGRFRHHVLIKAPRIGGSFVRAREALLEVAEQSKLAPAIDVDPVSML